MGKADSSAGQWEVTHSNTQFKIHSAKQDGLVSKTAVTFFTLIFLFFFIVDQVFESQIKTYTSETRIEYLNR